MRTQFEVLEAVESALQKARTEARFLTIERGAQLREHIALAIDCLDRTFNEEHEALTRKV